MQLITPMIKQYPQTLSNLEIHSILYRELGYHYLFKKQLYEAPESNSDSPQNH
mgnify:CR=1 FL=1